MYIVSSKKIDHRCALHFLKIQVTLCLNHSEVWRHSDDITKMADLSWRSWSLLIWGRVFRLWHLRLPQCLWDLKVSKYKFWNLSDEELFNNSLLIWCGKFLVRRTLESCTSNDVISIKLYRRKRLMKNIDDRCEMKKTVFNCMLSKDPHFVCISINECQLYLKQMVRLFKVILYSYLILKKMNERITDS